MAHTVPPLRPRIHGYRHAVRMPESTACRDEAVRVAGRDDRGGGQVVVGDDPRGETGGLEERGGARGLLAAGLDGDRATRREPALRLRRDAPVEVESVGTAVQRHGRLVQTRLRRHQRDGVRRNVRRVHRDDRDPAAQRRGQGVEQVALEDTIRREVGPSGAHGRRIDVGRVDDGTGDARGDHRADRSRAAAQVEHDGTGSRQIRRQSGEQLGAPPRHEDPGVDVHALAAELREAEQRFERLAVDPAGHQRLELLRRRGGLHQQGGLLFCEDAAGRAQTAHDRLGLACFAHGLMVEARRPEAGTVACTQPWRARNARNGG